MKKKTPPEKTSLLKRTRRSIGTSFSRFLALILIVFLSVGCYAGLVLTKPCMHKTLNDYVREENMYDFHILSDKGFDDESVEEFSDLSGVESAEGVYTTDALMDFEDNELAYHILSLPSSVNTVKLTTGSLPETTAECLADADYFTEEDIGKEISIAKNDGALESLSEETFTITGLCESPLYIGRDRGSTTLGDGSVRGFIYVKKAAFTFARFTAVYIALSEKEDVYTNAYDDLIDSYTKTVEEEAKTQAEASYKRLLQEQQIPEGAVSEEAESYVLTRGEDTGYVSFESDTAIVSGIAAVFPVFFIMVGMLVCVTTMSRMVSEERTQIGVLKALGVSGAGIIGKYLLYAGSAAFLGWAGGYMAGSRGFPAIFWYAYNTLYDFSPLAYADKLSVVVGTFFVAMAAILGSTYYACHRSLKERPAALLRPKPPKAGRRILLERISFLWKRLKFLSKVSLRNAFLSTKRTGMMLLGVGGCTALLVTGLGVLDSMMPVADIQYTEVQKYDLKVEYAVDKLEAETLLSETDGVASYISCVEERLDVEAKGNDHAKRSVQLFSFDETEVSDYLGLTSDGETLSFAEKGTLLLSREAANELSVEVGDTVTLINTDNEAFDFTLGGIFNNYIRNYAVMSKETYEDGFGEAWEEKGALILAEKPKAVADDLLATGKMNGVSLPEEAREATDDMLYCLNYVILVIVLFAGALAFVVIYNLTNINLSERSREVATVKVLGFYPKETSAYILRENIILSFLAGILGLPLGKLLHSFVLSKIHVDGVYFPYQIDAASYAAAFALTMVFAFLVNLYMKRRAWNVPMAASLKGVE